MKIEIILGILIIFATAILVICAGYQQQPVPPTGQIHTVEIKDFFLSARRIWQSK